MVERFALVALVIAALAAASVTAAFEPFALPPPPVRRQTSTTAFETAYRKFYSLHALTYEYTATISANTSPITTGTIQATFSNRTATSVNVLTQSAGNSSVASYARAIAVMFERIAAGSAEPAIVDGATYNASYGYPLRYADLGEITAFTITITSFRVITRNALLDSLTADAVANEMVWANHRVDSYSYIYRETCGVSCPERDPRNNSLTAPVIVNVHTGAVSSVLDMVTREPRTNIGRYFTIDVLFSTIKIAIDTSVISRFAVAYDRDKGYPTLFAYQDPAGPAYDAAPTMYISELEPFEVDKKEDTGGRWIVALLIIAISLVCCCIGGYCCWKRRQEKRAGTGGGAAPTDRTMAEQEAARRHATDTAGGDRSAAYQQRPPPASGGYPPPQEMTAKSGAGAVNYDV